MFNQDSSKNTNENENLTSDLSFNASPKTATSPTLSSSTNHDVEIANSTSFAPEALGVLTTPMEAAQSNNVIPPACIQHEATTLQLGTMSQFSSPDGKNLQLAIIKVRFGEDVVEKIKIFAQQHEFVCISGAIGRLYVAQIGQEGKVTTYEGSYNIVNLGGLFTAPKNGEPMTSHLSIAIGAGNGMIFGGAVHGELLAQSFVQITAFTWTSVEDDGEEEDSDTEDGGQEEDSDTENDNDV